MQKLVLLTTPSLPVPDDADAILIDALSLATLSPSLRADPRLIPMVETDDHPSALVGLDAAMTIKPSTIILRGTTGTPDIQQLSARLAVREAEHDWPDGGIGIIAVFGDTAASVRSLSVPWPALRRLKGLIFSAERLNTLLIGELAPTREQWPDPLRLARSLTILRGTEINVPTYDVLLDADKITAREHAERDGFSGFVIPL